jgi:signal transduction histidine kinase
MIMVIRKNDSLECNLIKMWAEWIYFKEKMFKITRQIELAAALEPNLISTFQFFLSLQLGMIVINALTHAHLGRFSGSPLYIIGAALVGILLLCAYLSWPWLAARLGRFYLPAALIFSVFISLLVQNELIQSSVNPQEFLDEESIWQNFLFLFVPLILTAWQYNFKAVILYSFLSAGLEVLMLHLGNYEWFHQTFYQRSILVRMIFFLVAGRMLTVIEQRQREQRQSLLEANRHLRHYAATLEQLAVTQERNRMSRELHDTLAHTLSGLAVQLEAVRSLWKSAPERSYAMLEDSLSSTRSGLTESRKAIQALRASPLDDLGLTLALRNLAESAASRSGAQLSLALPTNLEKLAPDVEQCIFRVAQESLENSVRHAEAQHISVKLAREDARLILSVCDDGQGFDPAQVDAHKSFGLKGLKERVAMFSGELQIHSQLGQGTTIRLILEPGQ